MLIHTRTLLEALRLTYSPRTATLRHASVATLLLGVWAGLLPIVAASRALDHLLYPGFKCQRVIAPIYIVAAPRSGSTFLHRLLARDPRFVTIKLVHTVLPAISAYRTVENLARIDEALGGHGRAAFEALERLGFSGWKGIHRTRFDEAEEDEMLFLYTALSPAIVLLFPYLDELEHAAFVDDMPEPVQKGLMSWYLDTLRRHLYALGPDRTLLAKNALSAGRLRTMLTAIPDMRIVYLVRDPTETIPSTLSMLTRPWRTVAPERAGRSTQSRQLAEIILRYHRRMLALREQLPPGRFVEVRFEDLTADPLATVERIYGAFGLTMAEPFRAELERARTRSRSHSTRHHYQLEDFGLDASWLRRNASDIYHGYGLAPP